MRHCHSRAPHFISPTLVYNKVSVLSTLSCLSSLTGGEGGLGTKCVLGWGGTVFLWVLAEKSENRYAVSVLGVSQDTCVRYACPYYASATLCIGDFFSEGNA